jgi:hypothetical protein
MRKAGGNRRHVKKAWQSLLQFVDWMQLPRLAYESVFILGAFECLGIAERSAR